jgi:hypothetical protein
VLAQEGNCRGFKTECSQAYKLLATIDAGKTFRDITPTSVQSIVLRESLTSQPVGTGLGFDTCSGINPINLITWWLDSPYRYVNVYIGGDNATCPQSDLGAGWVGAVTGLGWGLIPTWVGPQPEQCTSCTNCDSFFSLNFTKAASQATAQADAAAGEMSATCLPGTIIYYDLEQYKDAPACSSAAQSFVNAWVQELHNLGFLAGVYGSPSNADKDWLNVANPPDDVWIAKWNGVESVWNPSPIPNSAWANNQRIHQYNNLGNQTYGGITFNIDGDYLDGIVVTANSIPF